MSPAHAQTGALTPTELPNQLTMESALVILKTRGLDILIAEANLQSARADVLAAGVAPNPQVGVSVGKTWQYNSNVTGCGRCSDIPYSISVSDNGAFLDTVAGKRSTRIAVAQSALKAALMTRADAERTLSLQLKQQYLAAVLARDTLDFSEVVRAALQKMFELNQKRYSSGAISETDVDKVETAKLEAEQDVDRATQDLRTAKAGLAFLLGVRGPMPEFHVAQDLPPYSIPSPLQNATRDSLLAEALTHRPDLKIAAAQRERADQSLRAARRLLVPDIAISAQFNAEGYGQNALQPPTLIFGLQLTLPLFYRYQGERAHALADQRLGMLQEMRTQSQVASDVDAAWAAFTGTRQRVERMQARLLDRSKRTRDLVQIQYEKGAASLLEFLDAERTFVSVNFEYLKDLSDYWLSVYQLEAVVGMELRS